MIKRYRYPKWNFSFKSFRLEDGAIRPPFGCLLRSMIFRLEHVQNCSLEQVIEIEKGMTCAFLWNFL